MFRDIVDFLKKPNYKKIAIIDIETTNLKPENGLIIEIGIIELDLITGAAKILFDSLIRELSYGDAHRNAWIFNNSDLNFEDIEDAPSLNNVKSHIQEFLNQYSSLSNNLYSFQLPFSY